MPLILPFNEKFSTSEGGFISPEGKYFWRHMVMKMKDIEKNIIEFVIWIYHMKKDLKW